MEGVLYFKEKKDDYNSPKMSDPESTNSDRTSESDPGYTAFEREHLAKKIDLSRNSPPPPPTSVSEPGSSSTTMQEPRMMGEYKILKEFNLGDYVFVNKDTGAYFPVLSPVTDSQIGEGLCSYYASNDVFHTSLIIQKATLPPVESKYFDSQFMDTPAVRQLIETVEPNLLELQHYLTTHGVTSELHYCIRSERDDENNKLVLTGCIRFKSSRFKSFSGDNLNVPVDCMEEGVDSNYVNNGFPDSCINHIRRYGPVVGSFRCPNDYNSICEVPFYESKDPELIEIEPGSMLAHAVMITGYGLAFHVPTRRTITYYVIQNNWGGTKADSVGRLPCSMFNQAYAPGMERQQDLIQFVENENANKMVLIKITDVAGTDNMQ